MPNIALKNAKKCNASIPARHISAEDSLPFTLSGIWAGWYYLGQRVLKITYHDHPFLKLVGILHFVVYLIVLVLALYTLFAGITQSKEYAELPWIVDLLVVVTWVLWGTSLFGSMAVRREKVIYISLWYFIATFTAISVLYIPFV